MNQSKTILLFKGKARQVFKVIELLAKDRPGRLEVKN